MRSALIPIILMLGLMLWGQPAPASVPAVAPAYAADNLYNLANSYSRAGKPGLAVLNYERAALLAPDDPDIETNLDYVRNKAGLPTVSQSRFARFAKGINPTLAAWLGVLGVVLLAAAPLAWKATYRFRWIWITAALLGVELIGVTVANAVALWPQLHQAVILVNQAQARVTPVPMGDTAFVLKEAETVSMLAQHEDFVLVRLRDGRSGWMSRADIGAVVP
jgi:tetratricopeptide (TPR) repeat protein